MSILLEEKMLKKATVSMNEVFRNRTGIKEISQNTAAHI
jgi:hypothetical protein